MHIALLLGTNSKHRCLESILNPQDWLTAYIHHEACMHTWICQSTQRIAKKLSLSPSSNHPAINPQELLSVHKELQRLLLSLEGICQFFFQPLNLGFHHQPSWLLYITYLAKGPLNNSLNFIFPTKYGTSKSSKVSHWLSQIIYNSWFYLFILCLQNQWTCRSWKSLYKSI